MNRKVFRSANGEIVAELRVYEPPNLNEKRLILNNRFIPRSVRKCDNCDRWRKDEIWHIFFFATAISSKPHVFCDRCAREQSEFSDEAFGYLLHSDLLKSGVEEFVYFPKTKEARK